MLRRREPNAGSEFASQVFIGLGLGVLVGLFFGERVAFLRVGGDAFIALLQITVMPYGSSWRCDYLARAAGTGWEGSHGAGPQGRQYIRVVLWAIGFRQTVEQGQGLRGVIVLPRRSGGWLPDSRPSASFFSWSRSADRGGQAGRLHFCGGVGVGSQHGAVEHDTLEIGVGRQMIDQRRPDTFLLPAREPLVETVPAAERVRHQPPRATRPRHPQNRLDEAAGRHLPTDIDPGAGPQNGVEPLY